MIRDLHLIEFSEETWIPQSLRITIIELLECVCSPPFRLANQWIAKQVVESAVHNKCHHIVELGAGCAPLASEILQKHELADLRVTVCDLHPNLEAFRKLEKKYSMRLRAIYQPVDFSLPHKWEPGSLLVLSGTFHNIPPKLRREVLNTLRNSADHVIIAEPLRKNFPSIALVALAVFPALILPFLHLRRPGSLRRVFWCWLCPIIIPLFCWDGMVSALRSWNIQEFQDALRSLFSDSACIRSKNTMFCQLVEWSCEASSITSRIEKKQTALG